MRLPPLRTLLFFEAVGRHESLARAATELGVSPGAVSQQLRSLQEELKVRLVEKAGRGIRLTPVGRDYFAALNRGFGAFQEAQRIVQSHRASADLTVSAVPSIVSNWLVERLHRWQMSDPDAKIRIESAHDEPDIVASNIDFRITYGEQSQVHAARREMFRDRVRPVCSPKLVDPQERLEPADLLALPLIHIFWKPQFGEAPSWEQWFESVGAPYRDGRGPSLSFSLNALAIDAAANGRGVVLGQQTLISNHLVNGRLFVALDRPMPLGAPYYVCYASRATDKPAAARFLDWLMAEAARDRAALGQARA
ncbi:LysR family transcriptional regulator, glycine cleavage system transcriptional activator [Tistlia consotensis]|uniref:LysR family transcriptional regulator, glycine cleavage system transcriptional activator n=1 Tax=Tistlia consotensis USBA 355 TaxID=560819 RepID=A0A1Y6B904_9PROT|nr:LysR substrate-binding domain-containing protein [Tistlia consotensis]SME99234.1 LysR family transcriptional regulator, glycine cleavage system transcriptional activator [Tistlia consotensis USBA 355]SNR77223.1 LysR family transcriptional regulator, glycine cleavage system transcriptional activator [Tistlia consotensis]